ncbi:sortase family protein [Actinobaculum suis]|uniref:Sortase family protein n=1 Tax=Actinobaculum suis TaxID=1657 RepID=A0A7Z8YAN7_9ACTO|nr:class C sortase [Actinobaculum suis]VDG77148.1 sortase family protein [Actinobaculum suis]
MKRLGTAFLVGFLVLLGAGLWFYPSVAGWKAQWEQSQLVDDYATEVDHAEPGKAEQLAQAHLYNDALSAGAVLGSNERIPEGVGHLAENPESGEKILPYMQQLNVGENDLMARLRIPSIDVDLPVYHGTSDETLLKGAGHLEGTSLPVGGKSTHTVVTAHRGLASATMFTNLDKVKEGDTFTLEVFGEVLTYRVFSIQVVLPEESEEVRVQEGRDLATLITCTPLGINTHRILVTGERVIPTPQSDIDDAGKKSDLPRFPWWAVGLGVALLLVLVYWGYEIRIYRKTRKNLPDAAASGNTGAASNSSAASNSGAASSESTAASAGTANTAGTVGVAGSEGITKIAPASGSAGAKASGARRRSRRRRRRIGRHERFAGGPEGPPATKP